MTKTIAATAASLIAAVVLTATPAHAQPLRGSEPISSCARIAVSAKGDCQKPVKVCKGKRHNKAARKDWLSCLTVAR